MPPFLNPTKEKKEIKEDIQSYDEQIELLMRKSDSFKKLIQNCNEYISKVDEELDISTKIFYEIGDKIKFPEQYSEIIEGVFDYKSAPKYELDELQEKQVIIAIQKQFIEDYTALMAELNNGQKGLNAFKQAINVMRDIRQKFSEIVAESKVRGQAELMIENAPPAEEEV